jgi:hypothetical protein
MRDVNAALVQQVLDVPQRQWVPDVHHHRQANYLGRRLEVAEDAGIADAQKASSTRLSFNPNCFLTVPSNPFRSNIAGSNLSALED